MHFLNMILKLDLGNVSRGIELQDFTYLVCFVLLFRLFFKFKRTFKWEDLAESL